MQFKCMPVPVAARSKAQVYGRSPAAIVSSNPTGSMDVCCKSCVLLGRGLCEGLITRPEEYYRLWRVVVCDQQTSYARRLQPRQRAAKYKPTMGCSASRKKRLRLRVAPPFLIILPKYSTVFILLQRACPPLFIILSLHVIFCSKQKF